MKGIIIINKYDNSNLEQANELVLAFAKLDVQIDIVRNSHHIIYFDNEKIISNITADFIIYLDKDILQASLLENYGFRLFNSSECLRVCDNKFLTCQYLSKERVRIPKTFLLPLEYTSQNVVENYLPYPFVLKDAESSLGYGVYLVENENDFLTAKLKISTRRAIVQEYIEESKGKDIRVIVLGGKILCSMLRVNKTDFRSNISQGGRGFCIDLSDNVAKIALDAARSVGADYCGVDILIGKDDIPYICEVNSNALFKEISRVCKVDIAQAYATHVLSVLQ